MLLEVQHITKSYPDKTVIEDINLHLEQRELVCLLGVSGAGKTTLFHIIAGLLQPDCGQVLLDGEDITSKPGYISYMLQKDLLLPYKKVIDNVCLPLRIQKISKKKARQTALPYFAEFGLAGTEYKYPHQLSGGMRQRAALLRTYLSATKVALLDEPFSALDTITKSSMHDWYLSVMQKINLSTLFITHDIDEAILLSDRIYILGDSPGKIIGEISVSEPKPRAKDFCLTDQFLIYKRQITEMLNLSALS